MEKDNFFIDDKANFKDEDVSIFKTGKGLNENVIREISASLSMSSVIATVSPCALVLWSPRRSSASIPIASAILTSAFSTGSSSPSFAPIGGTLSSLSIEFISSKA